MAFNIQGRAHADGRATELVFSDGQQTIAASIDAKDLDELILLLVNLRAKLLPEVQVLSELASDQRLRATGAQVRLVRDETTGNPGLSVSLASGEEAAVMLEPKDAERFAHEMLSLAHGSRPRMPN